MTRSKAELQAAQERKEFRLYKAAQAVQGSPEREGASLYEEEATPEISDGSSRFEAPPMDPAFQDHIGRKRQAMKAQLAAQPTVRVVLPVRSHANDTAPVRVELNSYVLFLQRGVPIDVPEQIYDLLMATNVDEHNQGVW